MSIISIDPLGILSHKTINHIFLQKDYLVYMEI